MKQTPKIRWTWTTRKSPQWLIGCVGCQWGFDHFILAAFWDERKDGRSFDVTIDILPNADPECHFISGFGGSVWVNPYPSVDFLNWWRLWLVGWFARKEWRK